MIDEFVFKKLAHNDTGAAKGHQGGIVVPKDLAEFFPPVTTAVGPTSDVRLRADLYLDGVKVGVADTRYQHQTWGGTRSPERRLTDNLGPLRDNATADDIMLFAKDLSDDNSIQIHLIRKGSSRYEEISKKIGKSRWGVLEPSRSPVSLTELKTAEDDIEREMSGPARAFGNERASHETVTVRKARDRAFRAKVVQQYDGKCSFTGRRFISPMAPHRLGLDAAHVVPVHTDGSDHPANGLLLTKDLHWAFDRGMVGVDAERRIIVPKAVAAMAGNEFLASLSGTEIREAIAPSCQVLDEALDWHRKNVLISLN